MATTTKKVIAVVGSTGNQGSSVVHTFLALPHWHVRALTRDTSSPKAQELAKRGAEMVQADLSDVDSLTAAFNGANAIFVNTDFWAVYSSSLAEGAEHSVSGQRAYENEVTHGKNAVLATLKIPTLERFIYSALGPMNRASGGKYPHSLHWETKAAIVDYIENEQPELFKKSSFIYPGAYNSNPLLIPKANPQTGEFALVLPSPPSSRMPVIDPVKSTGKFVRSLVEEEEVGTKLLAYDSYPSIGEAAEAWSHITGKSAPMVEVSMEEMHRMTGIPYEVLDGAGFIGEFDFMAGVSGYIEPLQLKTPIRVQRYEEGLKERDMKDLVQGAEDWMLMRSVNKSNVS